MSKFGGAEIVNATPNAAGDQYEVRLAPGRHTGAAKAVIHKDLLEHNTSGKVHGGFSRLKFETAADKQRRFRQQIAEAGFTPVEAPTICKCLENPYLDPLYRAELERRLSELSAETEDISVEVEIARFEAEGGPVIEPE